MKLWGYIDEMGQAVSAEAYNRRTFGARAKPGNYTSLIELCELAGLQLLYTKE
jgi:hypothetical protein